MNDGLRDEIGGIAEASKHVRNLLFALVSLCAYSLLTALSAHTAQTLLNEAQAEHGRLSQRVANQQEVVHGAEQQAEAITAAKRQNQDDIAKCEAQEREAYVKLRVRLDVFEEPLDGEASRIVDTIKNEPELRDAQYAYLKWQVAVASLIDVVGAKGGQKHGSGAFIPDEKLQEMLDKAENRDQLRAVFEAYQNHPPIVRARLESLLLQLASTNARIGAIERLEANDVITLDTPHGSGCEREVDELKRIHSKCIELGRTFRSNSALEASAPGDIHAAKRDLKELETQLATASGTLDDFRKKNISEVTATVDLPLVGVKVPAARFFLAAPFAILVLFGYLRIYLRNLVIRLDRFDNQTREMNWTEREGYIYPWLLTIARYSSERLPMLVAGVLLDWTAPGTLVGLAVLHTAFSAPADNFLVLSISALTVVAMSTTALQARSWTTLSRARPTVTSEPDKQTQSMG